MERFAYARMKDCWKRRKYQNFQLSSMTKKNLLQGNSSEILNDVHVLFRHALYYHLEIYFFFLENLFLMMDFLTSTWDFWTS